MNNKNLLLKDLKSLVEESPTLQRFGNVPNEAIVWLGKVHSIIQICNPLEAASFKATTNFLGSPVSASQNNTIIFAIIHRIIAQLEREISSETPNEPNVFGPGAMYDFFRSLNEIIQSAKKSIFIVDPYIDDKIFDSYLSNCPGNCERRLLFAGNSPSLKIAAELFIKQNLGHLELRQAPRQRIHDRILILDESACWVLGQSIKDAATKSPTYIAPISDDVSPLKIADYQSIWKLATSIYAS